MLLPPDGMYRQIARRVELPNASLYSLQRTSLMLDGLLMVVIGVAHWVAYLSIVRPRSRHLSVMSTKVYLLDFRLNFKPLAVLFFNRSGKFTQNVDKGHARPLHARKTVAFTAPVQTCNSARKEGERLTTLEARLIVLLFYAELE